MKTHRFTLLISALLVAASSLLSAATMNKDFDDHGKALINPMMGWFHEFYSDMAGMRFPVADCEQLLNDFPGVSTVYMRFPWGALEPEEGKYNWSVIDWVAQQWIAKGRKIALRFITSATGEYRYATPKWVLDAGAKHIFITNKPGGLETAEVYQDDPIFLEKLENFLKAAAERYDGNPHVAFIDVAFGTWGEGHTVITHKLSQEENMRQAEIHANMYRRLFPNTLLVISDDVVGPFEPGNDWPLMQRLRKMGITLRDDSILILPSAPSWHGALAQHYWPTMPVIIEHQILDISIRAKAWDSKKLLGEVEKYHASYMSIHHWYREEMKQLGDDLDKINRRLGYRIQPRRISYPDTIDHDKPFSITMKIANAGVAPCYPGGYPAYTFKDSKGVIRNVFVDEKLNIRDLKVGPPQAIPVQSHTSTFKICDYGLQMPAGDYELWFSVGDRMGTPQLNLPVDGADEQGRIFVGTVTINSPTAEQRDFAGYWIWNNVNTGVSQAVSPCTRTFELDDAPSFATLYMTCDDNATVYINGREVIRTGGWNRGKILDVTGYLTKGTNLLAVRAVNGTSFSGMIAELEMSFQDGSTQLISTDKSWRASNLEPANWEKDPAVSASWPAAVEQYRYGTGPWGSGVIFQHVK